MFRRTLCACRRAFTLVELLVVIGIIVLLMALLLVALRSVRQSAAEATCLQNLHQIAQALKSYTDSYNNLMPSGDTSGTVENRIGEAWSLGGATPTNNLGATTTGFGTLPGSGVVGERRPLNRQLSNDRRLALFECPSDRGVVGIPITTHGTNFQATGSSYAYLARGAGYPGLAQTGTAGADDTPTNVGTDIRGVRDQGRADFPAPSKKLVVIEPQLYLPGGTYNWSMESMPGTALLTNQRHGLRAELDAANLPYPQGTALFLDGHALFLVRNKTPNAWPVDPNKPYSEHDWY